MTLAEMVDKVQRRTDWARPDSTYDAINSAAQFIFHWVVKESKSKAFLKTYSQSVDPADVDANGPNFATAAVDLGGGVNGGGWTNPTNAEAEDAALATSGGGGGFRLDWGSGTLFASAFGFDISSSLAIVGIKVEVKLSANGVGTNHAVRLAVDGAFVGSTKNENDNGSALAWHTFGSESELWGRTWTRDDVAALGVGYSMVQFDGGTISVDAIRITVYTTVDGFEMPSDVEQLYRVRERINASDDWRLVLPEGLSDPGQLASGGVFGESFFDDPISEFTFFGPYLDDVASRTQEQIYRMRFGPSPDETREVEFTYAARFREIKNANSTVMIPRGAHDALLDFAVAEVLDEDDDTKAETYRSKGTSKLNLFMAVQRQLERTGPPTQDSYLL